MTIDQPPQPQPALTTLVNDVAAELKGLPDAELRTLAGYVLSELRARTAGPASPAFSHTRLISDLQRRLADAHAYAKAGFGHNQTRVRNESSLRPEVRSMALASETKAAVLKALEEALSAQAPLSGHEPHAAYPATAEPITNASGTFMGGAAHRPTAPSPGSSRFEDEFWSALQRELPPFRSTQEQK